MKRIAAIFLILIHLLNVIGYYGLFFGLEAINTKEILADLDSDIYAGNEAITLRIPIGLPYSSNHNNYERVNGFFEHDGSLYRLVKQKFYNDTLYVVCYQDKVGKQIKDAIQQVAQAINDQQNDNKSKSGKLVASFIKEFESSERLDIVPSLTPLLKVDFNSNTSTYPGSHTYSIDHPPKS